MRSRERLIEVLKTVNEPDGDTGGRIVMRMIADMLQGVDIKEILTLMVAGAAEFHPSPHIRELSLEAVHYLNEDANG